MPVSTVWTVTVAYPLAKSTVASATCLPSAVFSCVVSVWAVGAADPEVDVVEVEGLLEDWFEQPLITMTGELSKAMAAVTCLIMKAAYPRHARNKPGRRHGSRSHG